LETGIKTEILNEPPKSWETAYHFKIALYTFFHLLDSCSVSFERIGCFKDKTKEPRLLPSYILTDRDEQHPTFSGQKINWGNWYEYLPEFVCRCAQKARVNGWRIFGIQFWGKHFAEGKL